MARKPRFFLSGVPVPVVQRGNNRQAICFEAVVGSRSLIRPDVNDFAHARVVVRAIGKKKELTPTCDPKSN